MFQCADLEHVGIVPTFPQGRVGENKAYRVAEGKQALLILHDQVIGGNIVAFVAAAFGGTVHLPPLFVDGEISCVGLVGVNASEVLLIGRVENGQILIEDGEVFLLEHLSVF